MQSFFAALDCFASLAMTNAEIVGRAERGETHQHICTVVVGIASLNPPYTAIANSQRSATSDATHEMIASTMMTAP
jgi:hypothetical protein